MPEEVAGEWKAAAAAELRGGEVLAAWVARCSVCSVAVQRAEVTSAPWSQFVGQVRVCECRARVHMAHPDVWRPDLDHHGFARRGAYSFNRNALGRA